MLGFILFAFTQILCEKQYTGFYVMFLSLIGQANWCCHGMKWLSGWGRSFLILCLWDTTGCDLWHFAAQLSGNHWAACARLTHVHHTVCRSSTPPPDWITNAV